MEFYLLHKQIRSIFLEIYTFLEGPELKIIAWL